MFRNFNHKFRIARIASLVFAALLIAAAAAPLQASGVTKVSESSRQRSIEPLFTAMITSMSSSEETIQIQTWIPGFDDDEPVFFCSPVTTPNFSLKESWNRTSAGACGRSLRMLPWISHPVPAGRVHFLLPIL